MAQSKYFGEKERKTLNTLLTEIEAVESEVKLAEQAGIPGAKELRDRCTACKTRIDAIKKTYYPSGK